VQTHANQAGVRYRYYVSLRLLENPKLHQSWSSPVFVRRPTSKTLSANSLNERLIVKRKNSNSSIARVDDHQKVILEKGGQLPPD